MDMVEGECSSSAGASPDSMMFTFDPENLLDEQNFREAAQLIEDLNSANVIDMMGDQLGIEAFQNPNYDFISEYAAQWNTRTASSNGLNSAPLNGVVKQEVGAFSEMAWNMMQGLATGYEEKYIGTFVTEIVDSHLVQAKLIPGGDLVMVKYTTDVIHVQTCNQGTLLPVGQLPKTVASWLAPLMDMSTKMKVEAHLPNDLDADLVSVVIKFYLLVPVGLSEITLDPTERAILQRFAGMFLFTIFLVLFSLPQRQTFPIPLAANILFISSLIRGELTSFNAGVMKKQIHELLPLPIKGTSSLTSTGSMLAPSTPFDNLNSNNKKRDLAVSCPNLPYSGIVVGPSS